MHDPDDVDHNWVETQKNVQEQSGRRSEERSPWYNRRTGKEVLRLGLDELENTYSLYALLNVPWKSFRQYLMVNGLLANKMRCPKCGKMCSLKERKKEIEGMTWKCRENHETTMRKYSIFSGSHFFTQDLMNFFVSYLMGFSLASCARISALSYKNTAVDWASFVRDLFVQWFHRDARNVKFSGTIEIDESMFGKKIKHHRGRPYGLHIWIFGLVERETNRLLMYPVAKRDCKTLEKIIQQHVEVGSTVFSDGWLAYSKLNDLGFNHFVVEHKYAYKVEYRNKTSGEVVEVHTNQIEGAWKHAKTHFRRINGTSMKNFESHLCEVMWRNWHKGPGIVGRFFDLLKSVYTLESDPILDAPCPVFDTWELQKEMDYLHDTMHRMDSDVEADKHDDKDVPSNSQLAQVRADVLHEQTLREQTSTQTSQSSSQESGVQLPIQQRKVTKRIKKTKTTTAYVPPGKTRVSSILESPVGQPTRTSTPIPETTHPHRDNSTSSSFSSMTTEPSEQPDKHDDADEVIEFVNYHGGYAPPTYTTYGQRKRGDELVQVQREPIHTTSSKTTGVGSSTTVGRVTRASAALGRPLPSLPSGRSAQSAGLGRPIPSAALGKPPPSAALGRPLPSAPIEIPSTSPDSSPTTFRPHASRLPRPLYSMTSGFKNPVRVFDLSTHRDDEVEDESEESVPSAPTPENEGTGIVRGVTQHLPLPTTEGRPRSGGRPRGRLSIGKSGAKSGSHVQSRGAAPEDVDAVPARGRPRGRPPVCGHLTDRPLPRGRPLGRRGSPPGVQEAERGRPRGRRTVGTSGRLPRGRPGLPIRREPTVSELIRTTTHPPGDDGVWNLEDLDDFADPKVSKARQPHKGDGKSAAKSSSKGKSHPRPKRKEGEMLGRCPEGFELIKKLPKGQRSVSYGVAKEDRVRNPYTKDNFVSYHTSDSAESVSSDSSGDSIERLFAKKTHKSKK